MHLATGTIGALIPSALRFLTFMTTSYPGATDDDLLAWRDEADFDRDMKRYLAQRHIKAEPSTSEKNVFHLVNISDEDRSAVTNDLCAVYHMLEGLVFVRALPRNFMAVPEGQRRQKKLASAAAFGGTSASVTPRFRFRIPEAAYATLRTDSARDYPFIMPALEDYGAPTGILLMTRIGMDGVLRRCQRVSLSIWDYWRASEFDDIVDCRNKGSHDLRSIQAPLSDETVGAIWAFGEDERVGLDSRGWSLSRWKEYLADPKVPHRVKQADAMREPLCPVRRGRFILPGGYSDVWYRPAMLKGGLITGTHYTRHCGVHMFLDWVDAQTELSEAERNTLRITFARGIGWVWPEMMLAIYSLPQRRAAALQVARRWQADRPRWEARIAAGEFALRDRAPTTTDPQLSRLARHTIEKVRARG